MNFQINFQNEPVKPWQDVCCEACWNAKREKCVCRCGGQFHGVGRGRKPIQKSQRKKLLNTAKKKWLAHVAKKEQNPYEQAELINQILKE